MGDINQRIDIVHTPDFPRFLSHLFVPLRDILTRYPVQTSQSEVQQVRSAVLDVFSRFPSSSEHLKAYVKELNDACIRVIVNDNEENATKAIKIV